MSHHLKSLGDSSWDSILLWPGECQVTVCNGLVAQKYFLAEDSHGGTFSPTGAKAEAVIVVTDLASMKYIHQLGLQEENQSFSFGNLIFTHEFFQPCFVGKCPSAPSRNLSSCSTSCV